MRGGRSRRRGGARARLEAARASWALALSVAGAACSEGALPTIELGGTPAIVTEPPARGPILRLAVGAMLSPEATFDAYIDLKNLLEQRLGGHVTLVLRRSYRELNAKILEGEVDVAFVCSGAFVKLPEEAGVEVLAVPVIHGRTEYRSNLIVGRRSEVRDFAGLRGHRFAFTDPISNTGRYYPMHLLKEVDETPQSFFSSVVFTGGHDRSIGAVQRGLVDGAAVDHLVFERLRERSPEEVSEVRVIHASPAFPIPPVVARSDLDAELKRRVAEELRGLHLGDDGRRVLQSLRFDRFVPGDAADYRALRQMIAAVDAHYGPPR